MQEHIQLFQETDLQAATIRCRQFALNAGLTPIATQKLATAVSELTRNVYKYAQCKGRVDLLLIKTPDGNYVQVDVIDHGPGIEDLDQAMADNYSSSGTLGLGLPGVRRLVDHFEIQSALGQGTRVSIQMK
tara:strand:- start:309 stop:701 length:393 start_codon:yes stop_codon:yes gene_type:complete